MSPQLFIMLKQPNAGRVKTRLGKGMGMTAAAWWFRHQSSWLIRTLSNDVRWQTVLAVAPDVVGLSSRVWPKHLARWAQGPGDLGRRMGKIFRHADAGPVVIIGADIPAITPDLINQAFRALARHDVVIGPAPDGGYWLIGMKRGAKPVARSIFKDVRWSSEHALADTLKSIGVDDVAYLPVLQDIDVLADLEHQKRTR